MKTHPNSDEGRAIAKEINQMDPQRTPGAWIYQMAAISAKYNEAERRQIRIDRQGRPGKSFRTLRGKLRDKKVGTVAISEYQHEGIEDTLAKIGCHRLRDTLRQHRKNMSRKALKRSTSSRPSK